MLPSRMRVTFAFHDNLTNTENWNSLLLVFVSLVDLYSAEENWNGAAVIKVYTTVF